ncbi:DUF4826 family protein [Thalassotalea sp. G2M2-11]|uniref:DUF4826 family protein n=1 Tax=Thalassotalea sp. G2M2-11 TaxID=2787627 RepID=UPI001F49EDF8|nr:DUF4826 family protein [Thalassotalea sp. G2M2-11]
MTKDVEMSEQEQQHWLKMQCQAATKFLASKGMITKSINKDDGRYLVPLISVWNFTLEDESSVWVITGDAPSDFADSNIANDAREVVRHFSLKWQMQADKLLTSNNQSQTEFAEYLINRAESLYDLFSKDKIWQ